MSTSFEQKYDHVSEYTFIGNSVLKFNIHDSHMTNVIIIPHISHIKTNNFDILEIVMNNNNVFYLRTGNTALIHRLIEKIANIYESTA